MPSSTEMGLMPSRVSDSSTPSRSPMPAPDQTDHSSARHRQPGGTALDDRGSGR